jgi:hypothetical protein
MGFVLPSGIHSSQLCAQAVKPDEAPKNPHERILQVVLVANHVTLPKSYQLLAKIHQNCSTLRDFLCFSTLLCAKSPSFNLRGIFDHFAFANRMIWARVIY